jgi:hypothetical protein
MPLYLESDHLNLSYSDRVSAAGVFGLEDEDAFRSAVRSAVAALPSEEQALRQIAESASEASAGACVLLDRNAESSPDLDGLRAVRNATAAALNIG